MEDIKKLKDLYARYKKIKGYADGGEVDKKDDSENAILNLIHSMTPNYQKPTPAPSDLDQQYAKTRAQQSADRSKTAADYVQSYAEGGEVEEGEDKPGLSPEEFEKHLATLQDMGYKLTPVDNDEQNITAEAPSQDEEQQPQSAPASEQDVTPENPDDKALESQLQNEDLQGQIEADKGDQQEQQPEEESKDKSEEPSKDDEDQQEPEQDSSAFSRLLASVKPESSAQMSPTSGGSLADAQRQRDLNLALAQIQRGTAIMGSGMAGRANVNPNLILQSIAQQEKYANLPVEKYQEQLQNQQNDPNSEVSKVVRDYMSNKGLKVPDSASAGDLFKIAPFLQKDQALQQQMQKALMNLQVRQSEGEKSRQAAEQRNIRSTEATKQAAQIRANAIQSGQERTDKRQAQRLAGQLVQKVNNDPIVKPSLQNLASLNKSKALIENRSVPLTPQLLSDAEQDISSALTLRGMGATEGKIKRTELVTIGRKLAELKQKYLNQPSIDLRKEEPELVNTIKKMNDALVSDYTDTVKQRKDSLAKEYEAAYGDNDTLMKAVNQYKDKDPTAVPNPDDQRALQMYQTMPEGPKKDSLGQILKSKGLM